MLKRLLILVFVAAIFCSCAKYKEINVENISIKEFRLVSASKVDAIFNLDVNNPSKTTFTITDIDGVIKKDNIPFANISLLEDVIIKPGSPYHTNVNGRADLVDPMSILTMGLNLNSWNISEFTVDIKAVVKNGIAKKTFKYKNVPLDKIAKKFNF